MSWHIELVDSDMDAIASAPSEFVIKKSMELKDFKLLRYLDPYGDTFFNINQMED